MNIKASIIGLIATTLLSSAMIANAAPVKTAAKPAVHASKTMTKHQMAKHPMAKRTLKRVMKRSHAKPGARVTTTKMTHRIVKVRHMKKVQHTAKTR
jgi:hypothetical protein